MNAEKEEKRKKKKSRLTKSQPEHLNPKDFCFHPMLQRFFFKSSNCTDTDTLDTLDTGANDYDTDKTQHN